MIGQYLAGRIPLYRPSDSKVCLNGNLPRLFEHTHTHTHIYIYIRNLAKLFSSVGNLSYRTLLFSAQIYGSHASRLSHKSAQKTQGSVTYSAELELGL